MASSRPPRHSFRISPSPNANLTPLLPLFLDLTTSASMAPVAIDDLATTTEASMAPSKATATDNAGLVSNATLEETTADGPHTAIFNRMPWRPPVAVRGEGIYFDLEDGSRIIDGVGGAAVACIGTSHPKVLKALNDQIQKLVCTSQETHRGQY